MRIVFGQISGNTLKLFALRSVLVLLAMGLAFFGSRSTAGQSDGGIGKAELMVRTGHSGPVSLVTYSPDGKVFASTGWDRTVKIWDSAKHIELRAFQNDSQAFAIAFSPNGRLVATGNGDATIRLLDVELGTRLDPFEMDFGPITGLAFSPDGKWLIGGSARGLMVFCDLEKRTVGSVRGHAEAIRSISFSPDGEQFASAAEDGTIKIWKTETREPMGTLLGHEYAVTSVAFSPDGKWLASASGKKLMNSFPSPDRSIMLWDVDSQTLLRTLNGHASGITSLSFSSDGRNLISGGEHEDPTIRLWDVGSGKQVKVFQGHSSWVYSVAFSPDGKRILSGGRDKTIRIWDPKTGAEIDKLTGQVLIRAMALNTAGDSIVFGTGDDTPGLTDGYLKLWDLKTNTLGTLHKRSDAIVQLSRVLKNDLFASVSWDSSVRVFKLQSGEEPIQFELNSRAISVALSPEGRYVAAADIEGDVVVRDLKNGSEMAEAGQELAGGRRFLFSPGGGLIGGTFSGKRVKLVDLVGKRPVQVLENGLEDVIGIAFSPDGSIFAGGGFLGSVRVWNVTSGDELWSVKPSSSPIWSAEFSLDGAVLVTGDGGGTVRLWSTGTGELLKTLGGHSGKVTELKFSSDRKHLFSAGADGTIRIWDFRAGALAATLVPLGENDWAVITPDGLFDASPEGRTLIHYAVGIEPITLEQMKDAYYVPRLLQKVLAGQPLPNVNLFSTSNLFPIAEYEQPRPGEMTFPVTLRNRGGGIGPVQVIVNGKEFVADARPEGFDPGSVELGLTIDLKDAPLKPGSGNYVEVVARNREGSLSSRGSPRGVGVKVSGPGKGSGEPPNIYAIIVGISDYTGDFLDLRFAAKDAERFAKAVELGAVNLLGDPARVHIRLLTDRGENGDPGFEVPDARSMRATKKELQQAFSEFGRAGPNDVFIVYLAGHGVSIDQGGRPGEFGKDNYLFLTQEATTNDRSVLGIEGVREAMTLSSVELGTWMKANKALKQVLILDTCAAGAISNSLVAKRDLPSDQIRAIERLKDNTGFYVLMGSAADSVSYEASQYGQGLLTYSLLQGMKGARLREGQFADVSLLFSYAQDTVPQLARNIGGVQRPLVITPDLSRTFDIGRFTDREQRGIALASIKPLVLRPNLQNENELIDTLGLTSLLRRELRELSFRGMAGTSDAPIVFVEADEMADAVIPTGRYSIAGETVTVRVVLARNGERIGDEIRLSGSVRELDSLVQRLAEMIVEASRQV